MELLGTVWVRYRIRKILQKLKKEGRIRVVQMGSKGKWRKI
jgi:hypothetical protein